MRYLPLLLALAACAPGDGFVKVGEVEPEGPTYYWSGYVYADEIELDEGQKYWYSYGEILLFPGESVAIDLTAREDLVGELLPGTELAVVDYTSEFYFDGAATVECEFGLFTSEQEIEGVANDQHIPGHDVLGGSAITVDDEWNPFPGETELAVELTNDEPWPTTVFFRVRVTVGAP